MDRLRCIVVDDEPLALMQIARYVERTEGLEVVATCYDAAEALAALEREEHVDLMFLDINMPDMSGMELARSLTPEQPLVIFTTAYSEYAVEGFKVEAVDYLTKPVGCDEFTASVERARRRLGRAERRDEAIYVKESGTTRRIMLGDISVIKGLAEYVQIFLKSTQRPVTTLMSLRSLEETLPSDRFMRIHRSYIVNLDAVEGMSHSKVTIAGEEYPVGESYRARFRDYFSGKTGL
ncbi:MAG: LytTR family DNA-binding domain-containing protein [Muribaculaceae bacterium]|nr:LytTR family DNA-binding domain-containing protein [Muribaculaceae bacterium]